MYYVWLLCNAYYVDAMCRECEWLSMSTNINIYRIPQTDNNTIKKEYDTRYRHDCDTILSIVDGISYPIGEIAPPIGGCGVLPPRYKASEIYVIFLRTNISDKLPH